MYKRHLRTPLPRRHQSSMQLAQSSQGFCHKNRTPPKLGSPAQRQCRSGYCHIFESFLPRLRKLGVTEADIERMLVYNPARALTRV